MSRDEPAAGHIGRLPSKVVAQCVVVIETLAFWGAVVIPAAYLPALLLGSNPEFVASLLGINVACLIVGHRHSPSIANHPLMRVATDEEVAG